MWLIFNDLYIKASSNVTNLLNEAYAKIRKIYQPRKLMKSTFHELHFLISK